ncbi:zinc finger protein 37-like isoform X7 [Ptychodera flava]|uniref:zinc finger protein 37-like isoform X7 n=1 Tax=Ptychodera flava TaxID=63121 RepID=UPI00396A26CA
MCRRVPNNSSDTVVSRPHLEVGKFSTMPKKKYWKKSAAKKKSVGPVKTAVCDTSLGGASTSKIVFPVKVADTTRCPTCNKMFDLVTIRPLIDTCGHVRCSLCMFSLEECSLCSGSHGPKSDIVQNPSVEVNISDVSDTVSQIGDSIAAGKCGEQGDQCLEERVTSSTNKQILQPEPMVDKNSPAMAVNDVDGQDGLQFIKKSVGPVKTAVCDTSLGGASTSKIVFPVKDADKTRCPTCNKVFNLVTIRPLIDTCGHVRCSLCMFSVEECPLCSGSHGPKSYIVQNPSVEVNISDVSDTVSQIGYSIAAGKCGEQRDQCLEERVTSATNKQILQPEPMVDENSPAKAVDNVNGQDGQNSDNSSDVLMTAHVEMDKTVDRVLADVREPCEDEQFKGVRTQSTGMEGDHGISESEGVPDAGKVKTKKDANHSMQCDDEKQTTNGDERDQINCQGDGAATSKSANRKYKCSGCGEIFQTKPAAQRHVIVHMFSGRDFDCDLCGANFKDPVDYARHMYVGNCEQYGGISDGEEAKDGGGGLSRGRTKKKRKIKQVCKHCGDVLIGLKTISQHLEDVHGEKMKFKCKKCNKTFLDRSNFLKHVKLYQNRESCAIRSARYKERIGIDCPVCQKKFVTKRSLRRHMTLHNGKKEFKCYSCDKVFTNKPSLNGHRRSVHSEDLRSKLCEVCGKRFSSDFKLQKHMVQHSDKYQCKTCGKRFQQLEKLTAHTKRHNGAFLFPCCYCQRKFQAKQQQIGHIRTHTGERPYRCPVCDKGFTLKKAMVKHTHIHTQKTSTLNVKCAANS